MGEIKDNSQGRRCEFCHYWQERAKAHPDFKRRGHCRFNPPIVHGATAGSTWPTTAFDRWCGRFESAFDAPMNELDEWNYQNR